jgi:hypothetical protein
LQEIVFFSKFLFEGEWNHRERERERERDTHTHKYGCEILQR